MIKRGFRKVTKVVKWSLLLLLVIGPLLPSTPTKAETAARIGKIRWGYYVAYDSGSLASLKQHIADLDYLAPQWFDIDAQGNISRATKATDEDIATVRDLAKANGVKVLPMIKNAARGSDLHDLLANPRTRERAVSNIANLAVSGQYEGIHIDFESIDSADKANLTAFMTELASSLRAKGKMITQALEAKDTEKATGWGSAFDYTALASANDLLVLMAYGYRISNSSKAGSAAPISWVEATVAYAASQIPTSKLLLGVPWYGYDWNLTQGPPATALSYPDSVALAQRYGAPIKYDEVEQSAYFGYNDRDQAHEVWFENARSLEAKLDLVNKYGLAGAAGWRIGHEDPKIWDSFNARLAFRTWLLAEGATTHPYHTWILIMNPSSRPANATVTFMKENGETVAKRYRIAPTSRFSIFANNVVPNAAFSTKVESDGPIFVERAMYFGHDGHDSVGVNAAARRWYLAEGFSWPGVDTWILLMNHHNAKAKATVTFMKEDGSTVVKEFDILPTSRLNIWADQIVPNIAFSTKVESDLPIVAERAMYFDGGKGGHGSMGTPFASTQWYLAEGFTGHGTWILIMNPTTSTAKATVTFMKESGSPITRTYTLKPTSRLNVYANEVIPNMAFSAKVEADQLVVVERSAYWANSTSGHSTLGTTSPATTWYFAEGSTANPFHDWILLMNPGTMPVNAVANFMREDGGVVVKTYLIAPTSRLTINVDEIVPNSAVSVRVDSDQPLVGERSMYFGTGGHNGMGVSQ